MALGNGLLLIKNIIKSSVFVGCIILNDGIELSYMFFPASWGKGLAKEAACASLDYGFNQLNLDKVIAITQEANKNSCCLLESIGMRAIDRFRRFDTVQLLYEITKNEYTR